MEKKAPSHAWFFTIFLIIFISTITNAQNTSEDVIYLKNGSVIRGEIIEKNNYSVKIESYGRNIWVVSVNDIIKITREEIHLSDSSETNEKNFGFMNHTDGGILAGSGELTGNAPFSLHLVNGYRFRNQIYSGVGIGVEFLDVTYVPVFGEIRYQLPGKEIVPFLCLQLGYNLPLEKEVEDYLIITKKGGIMINSGAGIQFRINSRTSLQVSLSYRYQELKSVWEESWSGGEVNRYEYMHRLAIRIGFCFQ